MVKGLLNTPRQRPNHPAPVCKAPVSPWRISPVSSFGFSLFPLRLRCCSCDDASTKNFQCHWFCHHPFTKCCRSCGTAVRDGPARPSYGSSRAGVEQGQAWHLPVPQLCFPKVQLQQSRSGVGANCNCVVVVRTEPGRWLFPCHTYFIQKIHFPLYEKPIWGLSPLSAVKTVWFYERKHNVMSGSFHQRKLLL